MQRLLSMIVLMSISMQPATPAGAAEGRVAAQAISTPDSARISRYTRTGPRAAVPSAKASASTAPKKHGSSTAGGVSSKTKRAVDLAAAKSSTGFYIYDAGTLLLADQDEDGHHREFRVRFDADSGFGSTRVYARLYLRRSGELDWLLYHTTDDFWIDGQDSTDDYFVTTTLDTGYPTGTYDVLIDLYETGSSGVVATLGPRESGGLSDLPLEEAGLDAPIALPGYAIGTVETTLLLDADQDGHHSRFAIDFDPDADFDGATVYARLWVRAQGGEWIEEHVTEDFIVDSSGTADVYGFTTDWLSGYPTAHYDVQIDLHDATADLLVASAGSERPELSRLPLEDRARDRFVNPPSAPDGGGSTTSRERGGGGALAAEWLLALLLLTLGRPAWLHRCDLRLQRRRQHRSC